MMFQSGIGWYDRHIEFRPLHSAQHMAMCRDVGPLDIGTLF